MFYGTYADVTALKYVLDPSSGVTWSAAETARMLAVLEAVSRLIDAHTRRRFFVETATKYYDGTVGVGRVVDMYSERLTEYESRLYVDDLLAVSSIAMDSDGDAAWEDVLAATDYVLYPYNSYPKSRIDLDLRQGDYSYWVRGQQAIKIVGQWGYGDGESASPYKAAGATITVATAGGTTLTASDGTKFAVGQTILMGAEQAYITAISGNNLTAVRGVNGTTAAVQAAATAYVWCYPPMVQEAALIQAARIWKRKDTPLGVAGDVALGEMRMGITIPTLDPDVKKLLESFNRPRVRGLA